MPAELQNIPLFGQHLLEWVTAPTVTKSVLGIKAIYSVHPGAFGFVVEYDDTQYHSHVVAAHKTDTTASYYRADLSAIMRQYLGFDLDPLAQILGQPNSLVTGESIPQRMATKLCGQVRYELFTIVGAVEYSANVVPWVDYGKIQYGTFGGIDFAQNVDPAKVRWATMAPPDYAVPVGRGELLFRGLHNLNFGNTAELRAEYYDLAGGIIGTMTQTTAYSENSPGIGVYSRTLTHYRLSELIDGAAVNTKTVKIQIDGCSDVLLFEIVECPKSENHVHPRLHWINSRGALDSMTITGAIRIIETAKSKAVSTSKLGRKGDNFRRLVGSKTIAYECETVGNNDFWKYMADAGASSACWLEVLSSDGLPVAEHEQDFLFPCVARWNGDLATHDHKKGTRSGTLMIEFNALNFAE